MQMWTVAKAVADGISPTHRPLRALLAVSGMGGRQPREGCGRLQRLEKNIHTNMHTKECVYYIYMNVLTDLVFWQCLLNQNMSNDHHMDKKD